MRTSCAWNCCVWMFRQASSSLEVAKISCRHLSEALQLAVEQRFAHEYDDRETEKHWYAHQAALGTDFTFTAKLNEFPEMESAGKSFVPNRGRNRVNYRTFDQNSAESYIQDGLQPAVSMVNQGSPQTTGKKEKIILFKPEVPPVTNHQHQALQKWLTKPPHCSAIQTHIAWLTAHIWDQLLPLKPLKSVQFYMQTMFNQSSLFNILFVLHSRASVIIEPPLCDLQQHWAPFHFNTRLYH